MFTQGSREIRQIVSLKIGNIQTNVSQVAIDESLQQEERARDFFSYAPFSLQNCVTNCESVSYTAENGGHGGYKNET